MKLHRLVLAFGVLGLAVMASPALATHSVPSKAKKIQVDLVRAYAACPAGPGVPPGNLHAPPLAFPGCNPPTTTSPLDMVKGSGAIKMTAGKTDIKLQAKSKGVGDPTGAFGPATPNKYNGTVIGTAMIRVTDHQGALPVAGSDITMIDIPFPVVAPCTNGKCQVKTTANGVIPGAIVSGVAGNIEIQTLDVLDPALGRFTTMGLFVK